MARYAGDRARDRISELAGRGYDLVTFWREASHAVASAVPFYLTPCFYTMDPASLLVTSHFHDGLTEIPHEWLALEYCEDDFNKLSDVVRSERGVASSTRQPEATSPGAPGTASRCGRSAPSRR